MQIYALNRYITFYAYVSIFSINAIPYLCARHSCDHLGAVLGDAAGLVLASNHEASEVLKEREGNASLAAQFNKVRALVVRVMYDQGFARIVVGIYMYYHKAHSLC